MAYKTVHDYREKDALEPGDPEKIIMGSDVMDDFEKVGGLVDTLKQTTEESISRVDEDIASVNQRVDQVDAGSHGNAASCYWNPVYSPKLVYAHNVAGVIADPNDPSGSQTRIVFNSALPDFSGPGNAHFAFNLTPVSGTGYPTLMTVVAAEREYVSFLCWHSVNNVWELIPATEAGFSFMVNDMDAGQ